MRLKKLEIYGFKSFAQRTEIVFNQGITGIVGPNGSGKSNIGDAVRWVLGEQSAKTLRGAKMEDIIFNGTQKRKPMSYCEVSLVFDNDDFALASDFAEVMVTRRVYRNGESEYYLNKTTCRLKDIVDLFRDTGIGKEGYSIIGQGRIDEILSQKGEDRRQVFEEAAGIVKFKSRKDEAERKLGRTLENLTRVEDILEELHRQLEPLEKQAKDARLYLELSATLKELELNIFLIRHDKLKERMTSLEKAIEGLGDVLAQGEALLSAKTEERDAMEETIAKMEVSITAAREGLMEANNRWHDAKLDRERTAQRLENAGENMARLETELAQQKEKLQGLETMEQDSAGGAEKQDAIRREAEAELSALQGVLDKKQQDLALREETLETHKSEMMDAINRLSSVRNTQSRQQAVRAQMALRLEEITQSREELTQAEAQLKRNHEGALSQRDQVQEGLKALEADAVALDGQVQGVAGDIAQRTAALGEHTQRQNAMQSRLRLLEEMARDFEGYNNAVRKTLTYAKSRNITSVRGVVAMLMKVPKELETAIDMVLGAALQNIATEDERTAKEMIEYLRENKMGRATFLPMNTIRGRVLNPKERQALTLPGCLGVASELIDFAPEYKDIMENLLGRTVVAEDLDAGIKIMRAGNHAFRLVTLKGDVMHSGGSMTGGSVHSKMTNLLGREREIAELQAALKKGKEALRLQREALETLEGERTALKQLRNEAMNRVHQEEIAVAREQERVAGTLAEWEALKLRLAQTEQACQQLTDSLAEIDADLERISKETGDVSLNQQAMEEKVQALAEDLAKARAEFEKHRELTTEKKLQFANLEHQWDMLRRDKLRLAGEITQAKAAIARTEQQLQNAGDSTQRDGDALTKATALEAAMELKAKDASLEYDRLEENRREQQAALRTLQQEMEQSHKEASEQTEKLHRTEIQRTRAEGDLTAMQERIWNAYELTYAGAEAFRQEKFDLSSGERQANELRAAIREMGTVNVNAIEDYATTGERYEQLSTQREDLLKAEGDLRLLIEKLLDQMEEQFVTQFELLKGFFSETFVRLFGGGHAELRLTDPNDALNCGIEVIAQPPGKKLQLLSLLSGGERALTAIAILFAMLKLKPTPFCVLDEIEAALDEANITYFADYLVEYSRNTQFVVVTHRKGTMERCNALYGVAMEEKGVSKMVSVNLKEYNE